VSTPPADVGRLRRRGFRLEYATMTWMVAEATVAITAGLIAASIASWHSSRWAFWTTRHEFPLLATHAFVALPSNMYPNGFGPFA